MVVNENIRWRGVKRLFRIIRETVVAGSERLEENFSQRKKLGLRRLDFFATPPGLHWQDVP
jgi:hypothetical protein